MKLFRMISQALCNHIPIETHVFTRTKKNGEHTQRKVVYECFKCGKRMR